MKAKSVPQDCGRGRDGGDAVSRRGGGGDGGCRVGLASPLAASGWVGPSPDSREEKEEFP
jgi:hypothetical protein